MFTLQPYSALPSLSLSLSLSLSQKKVSHRTAWLSLYTNPLSYISPSPPKGKQHPHTHTSNHGHPKANPHPLANPPPLPLPHPRSPLPPHPHLRCPNRQRRPRQPRSRHVPRPSQPLRPPPRQRHLPQRRHPRNARRPPATPAPSLRLARSGQSRHRALSEREADERDRHRHHTLPPQKSRCCRNLCGDCGTWANAHQQTHRPRHGDEGSPALDPLPGYAARLTLYNIAGGDRVFRSFRARGWGRDGFRG